MDYNWGDPKKNSLLSSRMMAKTEATRKKRLTSVKSTVSNQLHPAIEHKLRRKKKTPDSARSKSAADELTTEPQLSDDELSSLDTIRHDGFPDPAYSSYASNVSMFDEFDLNAAADGLFHPASTIEAFTEHDGKYRQEIQDISKKPRSGPRRARTGSEYPPSRENHRLPALQSGKTKRDRLSARPDGKSQLAGNNGSAPALMTTTSSLTQLLGTGDGKHSLSATQSDSTLYAPRRLDAVPSSADRNALDFLERELACEDDNNQHTSPVAKSSRDSSEIPGNSSSAIPQLDFSLTRKFEELKRIMKSNREKHESARRSSAQYEAPSGENGTDHPESPSTNTTRPKASSRSVVKSSTRSAIRATPSGSSGTKNVGVAASKAKAAKKRSTPAALATTDMNNAPPGSKRHLPNHLPGTATRKVPSSVAVATVPQGRSKKEMNARSGVSISDLKAEHREALQMLKELGGPVDPDYLQQDIDATMSKGQRLGKHISRTAGINRTSISLGGGAAHMKSTNQLLARRSTPPVPGVSMVTKLRESISSASRESSPRKSPSAESPTMSNGCQQAEAASLSSVPSEIRDKSSSSSNQITSEIMSALGAIGIDDTATAIGGSLPPPLTPTSADPWKQYEDDTLDDDGEEDNNELENEGTSDNKHYSDEGFESDW